MVNTIVRRCRMENERKKCYFYAKVDMFINPLKRNIFFVIICAQFFCTVIHAQDFDQTGVTLLRAFGTNLNGAGIRVGQPEAPIDTEGFDWEVNPDYVGQPVSLFTYYSNGVSSTMFPNSLGGESIHADGVGWNFYAVASGVATNVAHVDNYNADYFVTEESDTIGSVTNYIFTLPSSNIDDSVVNQSFIFVDVVSNQYVNAASNEQAAADSTYDNYAAKYNTLFVGGAGNGTPTYVSPPATCYNGIGVGVYNGSSSVGPTIDNGRCKPDITSFGPGGDTSYSAPYVSASAAILIQAGLRGDGGADTNSAANMITVKTLLLNGAVKPADWTNTPPSPLDFRYGAGMLNVFNSYEQLAGGKHNCNFSTNIPEGTAHPPVATAASMPILNGWDFETNTSTSSKDAVNHYFFNITNSAGDTAFTLTATLAWNRHQSEMAINNLKLFLYNAANSNLVASSTSVVDNVQHVFVSQLPQGRYDLQVWKAGGADIVSGSEPYALAWGIFSESLAVTRSGTNFCLSWPAYPAGFAVVSTANLTPPDWSTNNIPAPFYTNQQNVVWLEPTNSAQFFRLQTPNF